MNLTKIDWLGFRTQAEVPASIEALRAVFGSMGDSLKATPLHRGYMGYEQAAELSLGGMTVGRLAYGGESQRGWVSVNITGRGCEWVEDWEQAVDALDSLPACESRRVDIALDTFKGECSREKVVDAYRDGGFTTSGRPPKMTQIVPEDPLDGSTVYVGSRSQAKFFRGYDKGCEMVKGQRSDVEITHINGVPILDIYRLELELKPKNCPLPLDLIERRDQYFAGAYPYLQTVLDVEPEVFRQSRESGPQRDLQAMLSQLQYQYGSTLFTALAAYHGDVGAVWEKVVGSKHNEALLQAGVLLVDHE